MRLTRSLTCPSLTLSLLLAVAACGPKTDPLEGSSSGESGDPSGDPGGGPGGDPTTTTGGGNNGGTATGGGVDHAICDQYLACIAAVNPDALPGSQASFGPAGSCWTSTPAIAQQCLTSCMNGLASLGLQFPFEPACGGNGGDTDGTATSGMTDFTTGITITATGGDQPPDTTTTGVCNDPPAQPINSECTDASGCGCDTGVCFVVPALGGFCSECLVDSDCPGGGCTGPNPIMGVGARCNAGGFGDGCQSDAACNDPGASQCAEVMVVPGIITVSTCGECDGNADCPPDAPNCTPDYDIQNFTGVHTCKPGGSVPNDGGCDPDTGDPACASGHCGQASIMGLLKLGVCGECNSDSDCQPGQTCSEPQADLDTGVLIGAACI